MRQQRVRKENVRVSAHGRVIFFFSSAKEGRQQTCTDGPVQRRFALLVDDKAACLSFGQEKLDLLHIAVMSSPMQGTHAIVVFNFQLRGRLLGLENQLHGLGVGVMCAKVQQTALVFVHSARVSALSQQQFHHFGFGVVASPVQRRSALRIYGGKEKERK